MSFNQIRPNFTTTEWLADAVLEVVEHFGAASYETQHIEGHWRHGDTLHRDNLVRLVVDVPDTPKNRAWMKTFNGTGKPGSSNLTCGW